MDRDDTIERILVILARLDIDVIELTPGFAVPPSVAERFGRNAMASTSRAHGWTPPMGSPPEDGAGTVS